MHAYVRNTVFTVALSALSVGVALAANPTSDDIVRALKPSSSSGPVRGIRPIAPDTAGPAGGSQARAVSARVSNPSLSLDVDFDTGSDTLRPGAQRTLDELGKALNTPDLSSFRFRIEGHTDTVGTDDLNQALSERRAQTVAQYLSDKFQVPTSRMEIVGMGKKGLAVPTGDEVPEPRNRRVEVVNIGT